MSKVKEKYVGIHFNNVSVCLSYLEELKLEVNANCIDYIKTMHDAVFLVNQELPMGLLADVCARNANKILRHIEYHLDVEKQITVKFKRYHKSNYLLT